MASETYAEFAPVECPDSDLGLIQELLSYHMLCDTCCVFSRDGHGKLQLAYQPSPLHWSRQVEWPWAVRAAGLKPYHDCLDVGSGWSVLKYAIAKRCRFVECVDIDPPSVEKAWATTRKMGLRNLMHAQADVAHLPYDDDFFDRVFCVSVLEHVKVDHAACVREMVRVLKPGGALLVTLDMVLERGAGDDDFFMGVKEVSSVLGELNIDGVGRPERVASATMPDGTIVSVVLVRYTKPEKVS